ncbi:MAG: hypothetical protein JJE10_07665, partial [Thermoleophilia bacterium]|nr:hypothetical protein [Thermoleophilia bacterium]
MKQRLAAALVMVAALLVAAFSLAAPASASGDAAVSATSAEKKAKKAKKQKNKKCNKAKKVKKNKNASKQKKKKAKKACNKAKKKLKKANKKVKKQNARYFDVCKNGCKYKTIQKGVDAAGEWQHKNKVNKNGNASAQNNNGKAILRIQPATYVEGVLLHGKQKGRDYDHMTIMGVKKNLKPLSNAKKVILEGKNAKTVVKNTPGWSPGDPTKIPANNAIEGRSTVGLKLKNMWARDYNNNTFFVWASNIEADNERCADFVMDNLVSSDTAS